MYQSTYIRHKVFINYFNGSSFPFYYLTMIFDSRDLDYDISKDYETSNNSSSYNARSGLGLGLSFTFEHNQQNNTSTTNTPNVSPMKLKGVLRSPPPLSFNQSPKLTRKRSVSFGKEHVQAYDKRAPPDHVITNANAGSKIAYKSKTIQTSPNVHATPVSAKELTTRLNAMYLI
ncbi:hypothetical protein WALSEDRAFT_70057 [Wallemia mellicola CBS 633.66]|uniref:Uncharacterized protein n=2 Tax=Wallemia mellicola TaxID=1708541 RepID=A0A4T0RV04_9BASI|nr:hypothetical protein WALSEDRAFT_70057 [Wallemia mellicola CBS 633.66]TIB87131.1 hypothetical protein E3Q21_01451 [Wallemia mellicola]EIM20079.1 hypothetical protein WALSEDRAFT_70057 [Wallemia mellicola CBS 633.66]TIB90116.1 hypothetical protein E3Q20_01438 [Wallemia mellicola]TIC02909.1 hypothetical protein E3Q17_01206 [Wallemia mellicola]TIC06079.1 hypothetical protein E3Q16_01509 [Wallemia mellicola]|eukprot:XP_006959800.1 hypothetical protein WALSEDRAFT_70057 [Wallemia mellicola CBS 633.66]